MFEKREKRQIDKKDIQIDRQKDSQSETDGDIQRDIFYREKDKLNKIFKEEDERERERENL